MKRAGLLLLVLGCAMLRPRPTTPVLTVEGVATWRGGARAAYSLVHDDVCADRVMGVFHHADPELTARGLHAGFGAIAGSCEDKGRWDLLAGLVAHGHDVFNHSFSHRCLTADAKLATSCPPEVRRSTDYAHEIDDAAALFARHGIAADFFIFPFDVCDPAAVARLKALGFLGARCGGHDVNPPDFADPFAITYDVWGPAYSQYGRDPVCAGVVPFETPPAQASPECRRHVYDQLVDDALARGGWATREVHGFSDDGGVWEALDLAEYRAHLDRLRQLADAGTLWVEGPTRVLRYRLAARACALPSVHGDRLCFPAPTTECARVATTLSYRVRTSVDVPSLSSHQGAHSFPARKVGPHEFIVDADPIQGDATISTR